MTRIDVGCGVDCKPGYVGVDFKKYNSDVKYVADLEKIKLPFKDNSIEKIYTCHVLEHLSNPMENIREFYRILKVSGEVEIKVPYFAHPSAFKPNHKMYWPMCCEDYFNGEYHEYPKWSGIKFSHVWGQSMIYWPLEKICDFIIKVSPTFYEKRISRVFPFFELNIKLVK